jgi:hypothetical protein
MLRHSVIEPGSFQRPYLSAGHAADNPANTGARAAVAEPVRKVRLDLSRRDLATWPDHGSVSVQDFQRGPLTGGHATPSPGNTGDNNPVSPHTGAGHETYEHALGAYNASVARAGTEHITVTQEATSQPATARWSPPADMQATSVPQAADPGHLTGRAPGE